MLGETAIVAGKQCPASYSADVQASSSVSYLTTLPFGTGCPCARVTYQYSTVGRDGEPVGPFRSRWARCPTGIALQQLEFRRARRLELLHDVVRLGRNIHPVGTCSAPWPAVAALRGGQGGADGCRAPSPYAARVCRDESTPGSGIALQTGIAVSSSSSFTVSVLVVRGRFAIAGLQADRPQAGVVVGEEDVPLEGLRAPHEGGVGHVALGVVMQGSTPISRPWR